MKRDGGKGGCALQKTEQSCGDCKPHFDLIFMCTANEEQRYTNPHSKAKSSMPFYFLPFKANGKIRRTRIRVGEALGSRLKDVRTVNRRRECGCRRGTMGRLLCRNSMHSEFRRETPKTKFCRMQLQTATHDWMEGWTVESIPLRCRSSFKKATKSLTFCSSYQVMDRCSYSTFQSYNKRIDLYFIALVYYRRGSSLEKIAHPRR